MSITQTFALLFLALWALLIYGIGYYFGARDGKAKATLIEQDIAEQTNEDLTRRLNEARVLNRRLMSHFEVIESRLMALELEPHNDLTAFRKEHAA